MFSLLCTFQARSNWPCTEATFEGEEWYDLDMMLTLTELYKRLMIAVGRDALLNNLWTYELKKGFVEMENTDIKDLLTVLHVEVAYLSHPSSLAGVQTFILRKDIEHILKVLFQVLPNPSIRGKFAETHEAIAYRPAAHRSEVFLPQRSIAKPNASAELQRPHKDLTPTVTHRPTSSSQSLNSEMNTALPRWTDAAGPNSGARLTQRQERFPPRRVDTRSLSREDLHSEQKISMHHETPCEIFIRLRLA